MMASLRPLTSLLNTFLPANALDANAIDNRYSSKASSRSSPQTPESEMWRAKSEAE